MYSKRPIYLLMLTCAAVILLLAGFSVQAASVTPVFVGGNPTCQDLHFAYGFKPNAGGDEDDPWGTFNIDGVNTITISPTNPPSNMYINWSSTISIDAVIVKAGSGANVYYYNPESYGDTNLATPNNTGGQQANLSHLVFCYDYEVQVTKDAHTTYTRTYTWTIDKSVDVDAWDLFIGESGTSNYTVIVNRFEADSNFGVYGTITIHNPDPGNAANITGVTDNISGVGAPTVDCSGQNSIPAGGTILCSYSSTLPDKTNRVNTATVTTSGLVGGGSGTADVIFGDPTTIIGEPEVTVSDTIGGDLGSSNGGYGEFHYSHTFTCNEDEGDTPNVATINETRQQDNADVTVRCYSPSVTKTAETSYTRTWTWTVEKTGDQTSLLLTPGQSFTVNYTVQVNGSSEDSDWGVSGIITVANPHPSAAMTVDVADSLSGAVIDCGDGPGDTSLTIPASSNGQCSYSANVGGAIDGTNTATVTLNGNDFEGSDGYNFGDPTSEIDECVDVSDTYAGDLGTVCGSDDGTSVSQTFTYSRPVVFEVCSSTAYTVDNNATVTTNDTSTTDNDDHNVTVNVPCAGGCTLTQGYWKTHSDRGPAPYDNTWALLGPLAEDTLFFNSARTWYQVFWTAPAGNAYYILAHQYMAARLNILNGASTSPAVNAALAGAATLFNAQGSGDVTLSRTERTSALAWAATLDQYNNGLIGPGHCSEQ